MGFVGDLLKGVIMQEYTNWRDEHHRRVKANEAMIHQITDIGRFINHEALNTFKEPLERYWGKERFEEIKRGAQLLPTLIAGAQVGGDMIQRAHGMQDTPVHPERKELEPHSQTDKDQEARGLERNLFTGKQDQCKDCEDKHCQGMPIGWWRKAHFS